MWLQKKFGKVWMLTISILYVFENVKCAEITHGIEDTEITEDETTNFICIVKLEETEKQYQLAWERDSIFIALGNDLYFEKKRYSINVTIVEDTLYYYKTSILKIRKAKLTDAGILMCYLRSDDHLSVATSAHITVVKSIPRPRCSKIPTEVIIGENVTIACTAKQLSHSIELNWWSRIVEDNELRLVEGNQKVVGRKFTLNYTFTVQAGDKGRTFKCKATHVNKNKSDFVSCTSRVTKTLTSYLNVSVQQQNPISPGDVACFECLVKENLKDVEMKYTWSSLLDNPLPRFHDFIQCFGNVSTFNAGEAVNCTVEHGGRSGTDSSQLRMSTETIVNVLFTTSSPTDDTPNPIFGTNSAFLYIVIVMSLFLLMVCLVTILLYCIKKQRNINKNEKDNCIKPDIEGKNITNNCTIDLKPVGLVEINDEINTCNDQSEYQNQRISLYDNVPIEETSAEISISTRPDKIHTLNFKHRASTLEQDTIKNSVHEVQTSLQMTDLENIMYGGINRSQTQKVKPRLTMKPLSKALSLDQRRMKKNLVEMRALNEAHNTKKNKEAKETTYINVDIKNKAETPSPIVTMEPEVKTKSATLSTPLEARTLNIEGLQYADLDLLNCGNSITQPTTEITQYAEIRRL